MSTIVKKVNEFFKCAVKKDVDNLKNQMIFTERQEQIFNMYYIKKQDINFIADTLSVCNMVINKELKIIRDKMMKVMIDE